MRMCALSCSVWLRRAIQDLISVQNHFFYWISFQYHISFFQFYWIPTESLNQFNFIFFISTESDLSWYSVFFSLDEFLLSCILNLCFIYFHCFSILLNFDWKAIHSVFNFFHFYWKSTEPWSFSSNSAQIQFYWIWTEANSVDIQFFSVLLKSYWFGFSRASVFFSSTEFELNF